MESWAVVDIIEDRSVEKNSESKVYVFPKQLEKTENSSIISSTESVIYWTYQIYFHTKRKINFFPCFAPNKFLSHLVVKSKHKWQYCSQIYRITTVSLSCSISLFIRQPNNSDVAWDRYVVPFNYGLWLAVAITICAIGVCLALTNYGHERNKNLTLSTILFYIHSSFCQQGQKYKLCCFAFLVCINDLIP